MSTANSSNRSPQEKPTRPEGSPLFWHQTGRWCKKIRGRLVYFGRGSHDDALADYELQKADLHAGRMPRAESTGLTVKTLCERFLTAKLAQRDNGELAPRSFLEYGEICRRFGKVFGKVRLVSDLRPDDFAKLRADMSRTWGPVRLKAEIIRCRTPFNWALKNGLIDRPVIFGEAFKVPSAKTIRTHNAKVGPKMFDTDEIRRMLDAAGRPVKSMILLGLNCAFGNANIATLPLDALDLDGAWINHARKKTGVGRKCPLWPETVEALRDWLTVRPLPSDSANAALVFITRALGSWLDGDSNRALSHEIRKLLDSLGINGHRNFYCLRHTFQTIGDESGDFLAVRRIMGHAGGNDIADVYRERVSDERLRKVTEHVRTWLFGELDDGKGAKPTNTRRQLRIVG